MADDLTQMTEDELAEYRQAADEEMQTARDKKQAVKNELERREASLLVESLSQSQREQIAQIISDAGGIDSAEAAGTPGQ